VPDRLGPAHNEMLDEGYPRDVLPRASKPIASTLNPMIYIEPAWVHLKKYGKITGVSRSRIVWICFAYFR
jgi:hypothetical protein